MTTIPPSPATATEEPRPERARKPSPPLPAFRAVLHKMFFESLYVLIGTWMLIAIVVTIIAYEESWGFTKAMKLDYVLIMPSTIILAIEGIAFLGLVLGFVQFRSISSREQWALLVHRPIDRSRLFALMILSGLVFYAICVVVPLAVFILWALISPGVTPTFEWRFLFPHLAGVVTGLATYFSGILLSQYLARRFFAMAIGLGTAALAVAGASILPHISDVLLFEALIIVACVLANWGAAITQAEPRKDTPRAARAGMLALLFGVAMLLALPINPLFTAHQKTIQEVYQQSAQEHDQPTTYARIQPLSDGHFGVVVVHYAIEWDNGFRTPGARIPRDEIYSLDGAPLSGVSAPEFKPIASWDFSVTQSDRPIPKPGEYLDLFQDVVAVRSVVNIPPPEAFVPPEDEWRPAGEDVVFDSSKYTSRTPSATHVLITKLHVYISKSAQSPPDTVLPLDPTLTDLPFAVSASTDGRLFNLDYESWLDPRSPSGLMRWLRGQTRTIAQYERSFDATGHLIDSTTDNGANPIVEKFDPDAASQNQTPPNLIPALHLTGIGYSAGMSLAALPLQRWFGIPGYSDMPFWEPHIFFTAIFCNVLTAAGLILLARRYRLHRLTTAAWIPAGLLLGPLMILVFIGFHTRPVRERCPTCHKPRPVNELQCPHCKAAFPPPPTTGTEIFA